MKKYIIASIIGVAALVLASTASAAAIPVMTNNPVSTNTITSTSAVVTGYYNNSPTTVHVQYGTNANTLTSQTPDVAVVSGSVQGQVGATISNLTPNTTYYYNTVGTNAAGTGYGTPVRNFRTLPAAAAPGNASVISAYASNITTTSATLIGVVNAAGNSNVLATITFNGNTVYSQTINGSSNANVQYYASGLIAGTTYSFSVCVNGTNCQTAQFTTLGNTTTSTAIVTSAFASNITQTSATLTGLINANGNTNVLGTIIYNGSTLASQTMPTTGANTIQYLLSGLNPGTSYSFSVCANNINCQTGSFTTLGTSNNCNVYPYCNNNTTIPVVTTYNASNMTNTSATLNGYISSNNNYYSSNYNNYSSSAYFQYGTTQYGLYQSTPAVYTTSGSSITPTATIYNLTANTTYYFRLVDQDSTYGTIYGATLSFATVNGNNNCNVYPYTNCNTSSNLSVITTGVTSPTQTTMKLNGLVINNTGNTGSAVTGYFEYGNTADSLNRTTGIQTIGYGSSTVFSDTITGLSSDNLYYYRAVAQSANGGIVRGDVAFGKTLTSGGGQVIIIPQTPVTPIIISSGNRVRNSYIELGINTAYDTVTLGGTVDYSIFYQNITTTKTIRNVIVRVVLPHAVTFVRASNGTFDPTTNTVSIDVGTLVPGQQATVSIQGTINGTAKAGDLIVTTATISYTDAATGIQGDATAYVSNRVTDGNNNTNLLGAALFGSGFFPTTFIGWLALILLIIALIYFGRRLYQQRSPARPIHIDKAPEHN